MSVVERLFGGIKDLLVMREEVARLNANTERLAAGAMDHEKRLIRIETIIEMSERASQRRLPKH